jgi:hypothetical protein
MEEHHKVIIAAAVAALHGPHAKVRQIHAVNHNVSGKWALQGRLVVQSSHNIPMERSWGRMPAREPKS